MEFEVLKRSHLKRNIIIAVIIIAIISAFILNFTRAKYRTSYSVPLINGTINYSAADLNIVSITVEGEEVDTIPEEGYVFNEEESYCEVNGNRDDSIELSYDMDSQMLTVTPMTTKGTKCYLYFDEDLSMTVQELIASYATQLTRNDFSTTVTNTTVGTIYYEDTSKGKTYYFAGNPTDNWIQFAGFYWRIIRINEDGSIRMIYSGSNVINGEENQLADTSIFNSNWPNEFLGYMYTSGQVHGYSSDSYIKSMLDKWYEENLQQNFYQFLSYEAGFCEDRTNYTDNSGTITGGGTGKTETYYGAYIRLSTYKTPSFECQNNSDLYTVNSSSQGNKALEYPIGLISADEVAYAGGVYGIDNREYYLYTGSNYWTISPSRFSSNYGGWFYIDSAGRLTYSINSVGVNRGVRPVINLSPDVQITGSGTSDDPYTLSVG